MASTSASGRLLFSLSLVVLVLLVEVLMIIESRHELIAWCMVN
jgi:hypothetical protein